MKYRTEKETGEVFVQCVKDVISFKNSVTLILPLHFNLVFSKFT